MGAAYTLDRAAALAGVPRTTVHVWASKGLLVPSVSPERVRLWSYADLMGLRIIDWLRRGKESPKGAAIPRSSMKGIKHALLALRGLDLGLWDEERGPSLAVDLGGNILVQHSSSVGTVIGKHGAIQDARTDLFDVIAPFHLSGADRVGPDLRAPRPHLRILPGKLAGSPHVADTRIETQSLAALAARRMSVDRIARFYPGIDEVMIGEALELEEQLQRNLAA